MRPNAAGFPGVTLSAARSKPPSAAVSIRPSEGDRASPGRKMRPYCQSRPTCSDGQKARRINDSDPFFRILYLPSDCKKLMTLRGYGSTSLDLACFLETVPL